MSGRDSDSKRRHSRHDREAASPKRYKRDEKEERDERKHVPRHSNQQAEHVNKDVAAADKKSNDPPRHSTQSTRSPRSRSYHQHGERANTGHVGRGAGRREAGENVFTQNKEHNDRVETGQRELRDEKSQAKVDDSFQRRDGFRERKDDPPPTTRKRPAFREKKIPVESGDANPAATNAVKTSHADHAPERNERKEERSSNPRHPDRLERKFAEGRAPYKNDDRRDGFSSRVRYGSGGGNSNYRGRDKFNVKQGYHPIKTQTEKWTHDLYQEVNKDPIPKSEDDQIAKLEALLAS
ncbi:hypothetical protein TanjilG_24789 [Lupinus angustifolius]|uniref:Btz domain-containing protein n=1 Tax=Lupinus angustifolius TaxID=3871 RepID=A0A4P1RL59_LUPAN|nr:PREDICTED: uncharacterized protein DDB_G0286299 isoform X2 [Lupinus angustifolius]OIW12856.1 hypothetical protein TanjilG_24789 [Lupinus angustifolius]